MLPALYAVTLFAGAALLFLVQPLIGKLLLPLVGGTAGVWNTCMVFFQVVLLAGYLYAHKSTRALGVRRQALLHLVALAAVVLAFKLAVAATGSPVPVVAAILPDDQDSSALVVAQLCATIAVAVGVPFFVLSTTSPLLQRWFASTGHRAAKDPYFLYAASNAGSLLGLLAYPLVIEPRLTLAQQQWVFAGGAIGYVALVFACALTVFRAVPAQAPVTTTTSAPGERIAWARKARWVALAALPSSLLLGVTTHVSTDLAPVPLLWVVPLALYLISFIVVFARWSDGAHRVAGRATPVLVLFAALSLLTNTAEPLALVGLLHTAAFFGVCLVCHGELAKDRPPPEHLTAFYFWMSLGGALGGLFNALLAPVAFAQVGMVEYPLALVLAAAVRPRAAARDAPFRAADAALVLGLFAAAVALVVLVPRAVSAPDAPGAKALRGVLMFGLPGAAVLALVRRPARFAPALAALFGASCFDTNQLGETLHTERNFFGVVRVTRSPDGKYVRLLHGTTVHGQRRADEPERPRPMTHYHETGPVGHTFGALPHNGGRRVGVVGLGTGAVAHYARPGDEWVFYEIDPAVVRVAEDEKFFRFLAACRERRDATGRVPRCEVVLGDARRQLGRVPDAHFDIIVLDVCSDTIPVHLLTREAVRLYFQKLRADGVLLVHISNEHLDLKSLIRRLADDHGPALVVRECRDTPLEPERADGKTDSHWMLLARTEAALAPVLAPERVSAPAKFLTWAPVSGADGPLWRDDFANLLRVWKKRDE